MNLFGGSCGCRQASGRSGARQLELFVWPLSGARNELSHVDTTESVNGARLECSARSQPLLSPSELAYKRARIKRGLAWVSACVTGGGCSVLEPAEWSSQSSAAKLCVGFEAAPAPKSAASADPALKRTGQWEAAE